MQDVERRLTTIRQLYEGVTAYINDNKHSRDVAERWLCSVLEPMLSTISGILNSKPRDADKLFTALGSKLEAKMINTKAETPNPADFSRNDKPGEYTAQVEVRGTISIRIKADSQEDAQRQAEVEVERIESEGYVEIDGIYEIDLQRVTKDRPMYRVTREGKPMQVSHLQHGDLPRDPDPSYGF